MKYICNNGDFIPAGQPVFLPDNRGYRYGDGLFETMKVTEGRICLEAYHFERFFSGLQLLQFVIPPSLTAGHVRDQVIELCKKNDCTDSARVRLSAYRGNGGLYEDTALQYIIESWPLAGMHPFDETGLIAGVYPHAQKSCDTFSNLKSANYLPYVMAARYATANRWNDCLVLNQYGRVADATIANLFITTNNIILTPSLSEGCVNGVMRRHLLQQLPSLPGNYEVREQELTIEDVLQADEVFLTNAIRGIQWVKQVADKTYGNAQTRQINNELTKTNGF